MEWAIKDGFLKTAVSKFLSTGAPMPEGLEMVGRYHAPGSVKGWLIVKTEDVSKVYLHATEWAEFLSWNVTPVVEDEAAAVCSGSVWGNAEVSSTV